MNIVLIGTIGAGKTETGRAIAAMSDYKFADQYLDFDYSIDVSDDENPTVYAGRILEWVKTYWG